MTISVPVRSLDTHELMPGDIYPHPAAGGIDSLSHREVCSLFSDHIMYICSALVILLLVFIAGVFFRKIMTSSVERKRNTASVISDAKPEAQSKPEYFHLSICVEGPASTDDSVLSSLASRVVREAEDLYIPGVNRRDSTDDVFAWSVQTQFPSDRLFVTRIFPSTGWFERPDIIKSPVKCFCVCLQYTAETSPSTLHALVDEAGRQVAKSYIKGGHCPGSEGYTFCITS
ncbi:hypothetical protein [Klebsiella pneumoniae]|uniref:hypothetical protein n=1 Tax=Klebsiella pneumoniae TaxID=573 RepID=UPI0019186B2B|nr:hypothetical protein [Klebsiella pneumoniae]HBS2790484.1 hypothetical protein [Klebsiella pneumoniae]HBW1560136.1 hypothetical protein [Klebsiella quasipneumoniae subsp. similipneumoniae]HCM4309961.1 hypothetical protein [Klebsiella quasipneumoniae subsp. similipneumoniae]HDZ9090692.1 hypothetical protein [Klebsiella pneumoniae]